MGRDEPVLPTDPPVSSHMRRKGDSLTRFSTVIFIQEKSVEDLVGPDFTEATKAIASMPPGDCLSVPLKFP